MGDKGQQASTLCTIQVFVLTYVLNRGHLERKVFRVHREDQVFKIVTIVKQNKKIVVRMKCLIFINLLGPPGPAGASGSKGERGENGIQVSQCNFFYMKTISYVIINFKGSYWERWFTRIERSCWTAWTYGFARRRWR